MRSTASLVVVAVMLAASSTTAFADDDYFKPGSDPNAVTMQQKKSRTKQERYLIGGLAGGTGVAAGLGLLFHLDSRAAANRVSADDFTMSRWSPDREADFERAGRSGAIAIAGYSLAALLATATIVVIVKTEPGSEEVDLRKPRATVDLVPGGGAVVGTGWSF